MPSTDGDRMMEGENQGERHDEYCLADFGFDSTDGRLKWP